MIKDMTINQLFKDVLDSKNAKTISYGISDKYVPNWNETQALTEYVANFYDENGTDFTISELKDGIVLEDKSEKGILLQDLVVGNSSSREYSYKIGTHGEGFKLGALVLARNDKKVIIETIGNTIIFFLDDDKKLNSKILKSKITPNNRTKGSRIFLETNSLTEVKERFLFLNNDLIKHNDFLYENKVSGKNHIYVNTLAAQPINSIFSYSLFKKQVVNRDRNMLESPYEDILLDLFHSTDKEMIRTWLSCLINQNLNGTFEYEMLSYLFHNNRKKIFKEIDFSIFQEVAKQINLQYIGNRNNFEIRTLPITNPDYSLITTNGYIMSDFCEKQLNIQTNFNNLHFGLKTDDSYKLPIDVGHEFGHSVYQKILNFYRRLDASSILKNASIDGNTLTISLKKDADKKIDLVKGKTSKTNKNIRSFMVSLYHLKTTPNIQFINFDFNIETINGLPFLSLKSVPNEFNLIITDDVLVEQLHSNILFSNAKTILKNQVFQTTDGKKYNIRHNFDIGEEIDACFSYREGEDLEYQMYQSGKVVAGLFEHLKNKPKETNLYELILLERIMAQSSRYHFNSVKPKLTKVLSEQFSKVFGAKAVVSSSEEGDKKALYNGYRIIDFPQTLKNYFELLKVKLSDDVKGGSETSYDVIQKPTEDKIDEYLTGEYKAVLKAAYSLQQSLMYLFEMTKGYEEDNRFSFVNSILPYGHSSNSFTKNNYDVSVNQANYKKIIKEYAFEIFERTYMVEKFDEESVNGLHTKGQIFIKKPFSFGSFMHEYVHFSTDLIDICSNFEKTLSLVNLISYQFQNPSEKELRTFFNEYKKWLGVQ